MVRDGFYDGHIDYNPDTSKEYAKCLALIRGHESKINCIVYKNMYIITGSDDKTAKVWNFTQGTSTTLPIFNCTHSLNHDAPVTSLALNPYQNVLATSSPIDGRPHLYAKLWDLSGILVV